MKNRTTFNNHKNRKTIKSTSMKTKEVLYFYSLYSASQHLNICSISIQRVCDGAPDCPENDDEIDCGLSIIYKKNDFHFLPC